METHGGFAPSSAQLAIDVQPWQIIGALDIKKKVHLWLPVKVYLRAGRSVSLVIQLLAKRKDQAKEMEEMAMERYTN